MMSLEIYLLFIIILNQTVKVAFSRTSRIPLSNIWHLSRFTRFRLSFSISASKRSDYS